jgi:hypothetical protein
MNWNLVRPNDRMNGDIAEINGDIADGERYNQQYEPNGFV